MKRSLPLLAKLLVAAHWFAAASTVVRRDGAETGALLTASFVTAAILAIAASRSTASDVRLGGVCTLALLSAWFLGTCGPLLQETSPIIPGEVCRTEGSEGMLALAAPFCAVGIVTLLTTAFARTPTRVARLISIATFVAASAGSVWIVLRAPLGAPTPAEWIASQPVVVEIAPLAGDPGIEARDSTRIDHDLWLHRVCRGNECQLALSRQSGATEPFVRLAGSGCRPANVLRGAPLEVRWLCAVSRWSVASARDTRFTHATTFDAATLRPMPLRASSLRSVAGPMHRSRRLAFASPLIGLVAWLLARRRREAPDLASSSELRHFGNGIIGSHDDTAFVPALSDAEVALVREFPLGPIVIEFEPAQDIPFRGAPKRVRRIFPGGLAVWQRELGLNRIVPWVAASIATFSMLTSLAVWVR